MKFIENIFYFLFPKALLKGTSWESVWNTQEKNDFYSGARIFFAITFFGYILHYFTVDRFEGLAPSDLWFNYRFGMAGVSAICFSFYYFRGLSENVKYYRVPAIIAGAVFCYFQTKTILWYPKVPYLYSFAFVLVTIAILQTTVLQSILVSLVYHSLIYPVLIDAGLSGAMTFSASFFTTAVIVFLRTKYSTDLKYFMETQKNIQQQKKMIEINLEFTNQVKAFLPKEIARRLSEHVNERRMSVVQSIDSILRPKQQFVSCLFSDIRGFTKKSADLEGFVTSSLLPDLKSATIAIENRKGISRKIGDLIFAYFDFSEPEKCVAECFFAAKNLSELNYRFNSTIEDSKKIKRFILLSCGEAVVGNLSSYESAIEITAIGSAVNILSRIDELTKDDQMAAILRSGDIIMTPEFHRVISRQVDLPGLREVTLDQLSLKIRDFEAVNTIFVFSPETENSTLEMAS